MSAFFFTREEKASFYFVTVLPGRHHMKCNYVDEQARALLKHRALLFEPLILTTAGENVSMGKCGQSSLPC